MGIYVINAHGYLTDRDGYPTSFWNQVADKNDCFDQSVRSWRKVGLPWLQPINFVMIPIQRLFHSCPTNSGNIYCAEGIHLDVNTQVRRFFQEVTADAWNPPKSPLQSSQHLVKRGGQKFRGPCCLMFGWGYTNLFHGGNRPNIWETLQCHIMYV